MDHSESAFYRTLTNEDVQVRVETLRSLGLFAKEIGPQRIASELLPQLKGLLEDDDEVLLVLAEELGGLLDLIDEPKAAGVLVLLSSLCQAEEEAVRQKATASLLSMSQKLTSVTFSATYISLVIQLGETPWFTSKMSSCVLLPSAIARAQNDDQKKKLTSLCLNLCKDSTPMARRAAGGSLKDVIPHLTYETLTAGFVDAFINLSKDEQDSVRLLAVDVGTSLALSFCKFKKPEQVSAVVLPVILSLAEDKSWRVRYMVANSYVNLATAISQDMKHQLVQVFIKLLKDSEQEVRTAAAGNVSGVAKLVSVDEVIVHLLPCVGALVTDSSQIVRAALAKDIMVLSPLFGVDGTLNHLLTLYLRLLKDDVPEVRLNLIGKLDQVTPFVGLEKLSEDLIPAIIELGEDKSWRIRLAVIGNIPPLAAQLNLDFFITKLGSLCFSWLADTVYAVRQAAIANLKNLTVVFGEPFSRVVVPRISSLCTNTNYLHRMTILFYAETVGTLMSPTFLQEFILPLVFRMAVDPVANIRFASARAIEALVSTMTAESKTQSLQVIKLLIADKDPDVREAAQNANKKL